jgi:hypothetical protein
MYLFWEELIAYIPFTTILVSDTSIKETLVCTYNEVNKTILFWRLQCWYYRWGLFTKYTVERASGGMTHTYQILWLSVREFEQY